MHRAVGLGDFEEAVEQILEHGRFVRQKARHVARVGFKAGNVAFGEIIDAGDIPLFARRNGEDAGEGVDLGAGHDAVGLRHLGGEGDHADGESRLAARLAVGNAGKRARSPETAAPMATRAPARCRQCARKSPSVAARQIQNAAATVPIAPRQPHERAGTEALSFASPAQSVQFPQSSIALHPIP